MLIMTITMTTQAQTKIGLKLEYGISNTIDETANRISQSDDIFYSITTQGKSNTTSLGLSLRQKAGYVQVGADVLLSKYSRSYMVENFQIDGGLDGLLTENNYQLDIPLKIGVNHRNFSFTVGPQIQYSLSKDDVLSNLEGLEDRSRKLSTGYNMSLGYDFGLGFVDLSYYKNFSAEGNGIYIDDVKTRFTGRDQQLKLAVGYNF